MTPKTNFLDFECKENTVNLQKSTKPKHKTKKTNTTNDAGVSSVSSVSSFSNFSKTTIDSDIDGVIAAINSLDPLSSNSVQLLIDSRERDTDILGHLNKLDNVKTEQLASGDFIILLQNKFAFVIERKRLDDLASSISSHQRLRKQTQNMITIFPEIRKSHYERTRAIFLIEKMKKKLYTSKKNELNEVNNDDCNWIVGDDSYLDSQRISRKALSGSMVNRLVKYNMTTITSESAKHSALIIVQIMLSLSKNHELWIPRLSDEVFNSKNLSTIMENPEFETNEERSDFLNTRTLKQAYTQQMKYTKQQNLYIQQLLLIDRMTIDFALSIVNLYTSPVLLSEYLSKTNPQEVVNKLSQLTTTKSQKKFGPQLAIKLYNVYINSQLTVKNNKVVQEIEETETNKTDETTRTL